MQIKIISRLYRSKPLYKYSGIPGIQIMLGVLLCACSYAHNEPEEVDNTSDSMSFMVTFDLQPQLALDWIDSSQHFWKSDWGNLGYDEPESYHLDYFCLPNDTGRRTGQRNLFGTNNYITLYEGEFEMLIYNNDFDYITVDYSGDEHEIMATTSVDSQCELGYAPDGQLIKYQPDKLLINHFFLSLNSQVPGCVMDSSGKKYLLTNTCELAPATRIYLIAIDLKQNFDMVRDCDLAIVGGLAPKIELYTQALQGESIAHNADVYFANDYAIVRLICFGAAPETESQMLWLRLKYANGYNIAEIDLTEAFAEKPTGGMIHASINIAEDYPGPENPSQGSGGLNASVSGWDGEENYYIEL